MFEPCACLQRLLRSVADGRGGPWVGVEQHVSSTHSIPRMCVLAAIGPHPERIQRCGAAVQGMPP